MSAIKYWVWLSAQTDVSPRSKAALLAHYGGAEEAFFAPAGEFAHVPGVSGKDAEVLERRDTGRVNEILERCRQLGVALVSRQDAAYPTGLRHISAPPVLLYVQGSLSCLADTPAVAVIGTRRASPYGMKMARRLAYEISSGGAVVVSTLSSGIDEQAVRGALLAGGSCVGVLGTGHTDVPGSLHRDVAASAALISEYPPDSKVQKFFFRDRNRIASALSTAVLVIEAPEKSGALLFAAEALEQGRELFALPGNADSENSVGPISLIKQGAKPVTCGWDVLEELQPLYPGRLHRPGEMPRQQQEEPAQSEDKPAQAPVKKDIDNKKSKGYIDLKEQLSSLSEEQLKIIAAIDSTDAHIDDIIEATGLGAAKVLSQLTMLEIKGYVRRVSGRRISLNTAKK